MVLSVVYSSRPPNSASGMPKRLRRMPASTRVNTRVGASATEMADAQAGHSNDPQTAAALAFALKVVERRADVDATDVQALRNAGFDDEAVVELLAHIALNLFTNYVNVALDVPVDFPKVALRQAA